MSINYLLDAANGNGRTMWIMIILIAVLFVIMIVPSYFRRKKQAKEIEDKLNGLAVGDTIKTIGMLCGEIVEFCADGTIVLKTGSDERVGYIRIDRQAIYQIIKPQDKAVSEPFADETAKADKPAEPVENTNGADAPTETPEGAEEAAHEASASGEASGEEAREAEAAQEAQEARETEKPIESSEDPENKE